MSETEPSESAQILSRNGRETEIPDFILAGTAFATYHPGHFLKTVMVPEPYRVKRVPRSASLRPAFSATVLATWGSAETRWF
jgi:hypothetical protein